MVMGIVAASSSWGCTASPPEMPTAITSIDASHYHGSTFDGEKKQLELDETALLSCLSQAQSLGIGKAQKCALEDSEYKVILNGGEIVIEIHTATQFTIDHQGFFSSQCLYPMLAKAAHGEAPPPSDC